MRGMVRESEGIKINAIFFDAGETLIHPEPSFTDLFLQVCSCSGFNPTREKVAFSTGELLRELEDMQDRGYTFTTSERESRAFWLRFYCRLLEGLGLQGDVKGLAETLYRTFSDPVNYRIYPDVLPTLRELHADGYVMGVISNFEPWLVDLLEDQGVRRYFRTLGISGLVGAEKPQLAIFEWALREAGVEPARALHVGDSLRADVEGAHRAGIAPVLLDRHDRHPEPPCARISDLRELPEMLRRGGF